MPLDIIKIMYIADKLIKTLEPHKGDTIDVNFMISLIKSIAEEHEKLTIPDVVGQIDQKRYCKDCGDFVGDGCDNKDCKYFKTN